MNLKQTHKQLKINEINRGEWGGKKSSEGFCRWLPRVSTDLLPPASNMAGMQFEYDEQGGTFLYFLLCFWLAAIVSATCYFFPRKSNKGK